MKFRVKRGDFLHELAYITPVVEKSTKMPILSHVLLDARGEEQKILLAGSDLDISIKATCPALIEEPGAIALPARELTDIVRYMPEDAEIEIATTDQERVLIRSGRTRYRLVCLPDDTFPTIPPQPEGLRLTIPGEMLRKMIQMTIFSITQEQTRFTLSGVLLSINRNFIKMVSTDGHRMAYVESPKAFEDLETELKILIPKKTVAELAKLLTLEKIDVQFAHDENHLFFKVQDRLLVSRLLAGQFPNYELVIPRNLQQRVALSADALKLTINRMNVLADEVSKRVIFKVEKGRILLQSENVSKGEAEEEIDIDYDGDPVVLGFNSQYLLEFLNVVETDEVNFEFTDEEAAGMFRPRGELEYTYKYIVMPMST